MADKDFSKTCSTCCQQLPQDLFYRDSGRLDGLQSRCKKCHGISTKQYAQTHRAQYAEQMRARRAAEPDKYRAIGRSQQAAAYARNPEKHRERSRVNRLSDPLKTAASSNTARRKKPEQSAQYQADYYERHKTKIKTAVRQRAQRLGDALKPANAEKSMRRLAKKRCATPAWASRQAILSFYQTAMRLTVETGMEHQVDHIVPLQGKTVSGLHVENNLQILLKPDNQSKGNRYWPDQP